jgi:hypothetical protein
VTSIRDDAFCGCSSLTSLTIPDNVINIGKGAFRDCSSIATIAVDMNNTIYDSREECNAIIETATNTLIFGCQNTIIPSSVTSIGESAFYHCDSLKTISIPENVTSIGDLAFYCCSSLTDIAIPNTVTNIGKSAFSDCKTLTSLTIPAGVIGIGNAAFAGCSSLTDIVVDKNNTVYDSRKECNAIIETATNILIVGCQSTSIPNSVTSIGSYAFDRCSTLTAITIGKGVARIGERAFRWCDCLTTITISSSITSIGEEAFAGCSSLTSITIPDSVTSIRRDAFYNCSSLTAIRYKGTIKQWKQVTLGKDWSDGIGAYSIRCTDGDKIL